MRFARTYVLALPFLLLAFPAVAQVPDPTTTALAPVPGVGHNYIGMGGETVNPADGSISFDLPIQTPPGRQLSFPFGIHFNSAEILSINNSLGELQWATPLAPPFELNGWSYAFPALTGVTVVTQSRPDPSGHGTDYCLGSANLVFRGFQGVDSLGSPPLTTINQWPYNTFDANPSNTLSCWASIAPPVLLGGFNGSVATLPGPLNVQPQQAITVVDRAGTIYQFPSFNEQTATSPQAWGLLAQTITDRNGNQITGSGSDGYNFGSGNYVDTLGRSIVSWTGIGSSTGDQLAISGLPGNIVVKWTSTTLTPPQSSQFISGVITPSGTPNCHFNSSPQQSVQVKAVSEIDLPNGQKYTFQYGGPYGELLQINFPGHGYVRYVWGPSSLSTATLQHYSFSANGTQYEASCYASFTSPAITDRYVSYDGSTEVLHQQFNYSTPPFGTSPYWTSKTTTVTSTDLVTSQVTKTIYTYTSVAEGGGTPSGPDYQYFWLVNQIPVEKQILYQDGSGNTLKTVNKTWLDEYAMIGEQTILDNGQGMTTLRCYDSATGNRLLDEYEYGFQSEGSYPGDPACASLPSGTTLSSGLTSSALGPLRRHSSKAYHNFGSVNILDLPDTVTLFDGSGNTASQAKYFYDQNTLQSSGAINLTNPGPTRGNLTTLQRLVSGTTYATTTATYYDTGQPYTMTDPCGNATCSDMNVSGETHTTVYSYADSYTILSNGQNVSYTPSGNTNAYLTKITYPTTVTGDFTGTHPVQHVENFTYDFNNGQLTISKDENSQPTTYLYNDSLARPNRINYPDQGQTTISYNDAPPSPSVTTSRKIDTSGRLLTTVSIADGLGHVVQSRLCEDGSACTQPIKADITYDGLGGAYKKSNPHRSSSLSTDGTTTYIYDALGRTCLVVPADAPLPSSATCPASQPPDTVFTAYSGNCVTVTDEAGKSRRSCSDGLGRLIEVDEPGAGANNASPGTATVTISGTEQSQTAQAGSGSISLSSGSANCVPVGGNNYAPQNGTITVTINGATPNVGWGGNCSGSAETLQPAINVLASNLATAITNSSAGVTATPNGSSITLTAKTTGASTNYSVSISETWGFSTGQGGTGYTACCSGSLSGGRNASTDSGTASITVNGFPASYSWGASDSASSIASGLQSQLNSGSSPVTATASGGTITLTAEGLGSATNYSLSGSIQDTAGYSPASFSINAPSSLTGGTNSTLGTPLVTLYTYDALDNLLTVNQKGGSTDSTQWRPRSFVYDSLSHLTSATNPESGTINYYYDANGNLTTRAAPAPNQTGTATLYTSYGYDALNRNIWRVYSDSEPNVQFSYDQSSVLNGVSVSNPIGQLTAENTNTNSTYPTASVFFSYDPMGRVLSYFQCVLNCATSSWDMYYTYDLLGNITSYTNALGTTFTQTFDNAGRLSQVSSSLVDPQHPGALATVDSSVGYWPAGGLRKLALGNGLYETAAYNNRMQPCRVNVNSSGGYYSQCSDALPTGNVQDFNHAFNFGSSDNGNVASWSATGATGAQNFSRSYTYDSLNRLATMSATSDPSGCNGLSWTYDAWGNRNAQTVTAGSCYQQPDTTFSAQNQFPPPYQYDAAGNMTADGSHTYFYDAENRPMQVDGSSGYCSTNTGTPATACYLYDAIGKRVQKTTGATTTTYLYDLTGNVINELDGNSVTLANYIYFGGSLLAEYKNATTYFVHKDHLGSTRLLTAMDKSIYDNMDYLPFGEQLAGGSATTHKFTSKERDSESGLDNFDFRYNSSSLGRFMSPDPVGGHITNPQSLNRYSYVLNNPLNLVDPFGLDSVGGESQDTICTGTGPGPYSCSGTSADVIPVLPAGIPDTAPDLTGGTSLPQVDTAAALSSLTPGSVAPGVASNSPSSSPGLDGAQMGLGVLGMIPGPVGTGANLINAGISLYRGQYGQAALNAAFAIPFVGTFGRAAQLGEGALEAAKGVEGIYEFVGSTGRIYVGQSGNIGLRLAQHIESGALLEGGISSIRFTEVTGGKLAREIAEQLRIEEFGGVRGGNLQNVRNAIGAARDYLMVPLRQ